jgi:group I intron endonuclease
MSIRKSSRKQLFYCYKLTCTINDKGYIGIAVGGVKRRFIQHKHDAKRGALTPLHQAMRKHGPENFVLEIIGKADSWEEICSLEQEMIAKDNTLARNGRGYNVATGGQGPYGVERSPETRQKLSRITKRWMEEDPTRIEKLKEIGRQQMQDPEQREISRQGALEAWRRSDYREVQSRRVKEWAKANRDSMIKNQREVMARPGSKENLRLKGKDQMKKPLNRELSKKGALKQWQNPSFKEKMTQQMREVGRKNWQNQEYKERMKQIGSKPIIAASKHYPSLEEAANALGVKANTICGRLKNPNFPDYYYLPLKRYVIVDGVQYPSVNAAAKAVGISNAVCLRRIYSEDFPEYQIVDD